MNDDKSQKLNNTLVDDMVGQEEAVVFSEAELSVLREMAQKGVMFGHKKTRTNPKFRNFIFSTRNGMDIIDLSKTVKGIETAAEFLKEAIVSKKTVLMVGTHPASWEALNNLALKFNFSFVKNGWIGGLLTNYKNISERLEYFKGLKSGMEKGDFEKYTKKERVMMNKEIARMQAMFDGFENLEKLPDIVFIVDTSIKGHLTALKEAKIAKIPVVAIIDTDDDPTLVEYPIPANDHSKMSIDWVVGKLVSLIEA